MGRTKVDHSRNVGKKFGRLTILSTYSWKNYVRYCCRCECGHLVSPLSFSVINGSTTSCGCFYTESRGHKKVKPRSDIKPGGASARNYVFLTYRRSAKLRNYEFLLTKDDFAKIVSLNCHYCGSPPGQVAKYSTAKKSEAFIYSGIDRVDNASGYTLDNCVPCCNTCNKAKGVLSLKEFLGWIERIKNYDRNTM